MYKKQQIALNSTGVLLLRYSHLHENCGLLGFYAPSSGYFIPNFRDNLSTSFSGFKNQESYGFLNPNNGTDMLSRNVGNKLPLLAA